MKRRKSVHF